MNRRVCFQSLLGLCVVAAIAGLAVANTRQEQSSTASKVEFEAASIKLNRSGSSGHHEHFTHGRLVAVNITVKSLIEDAYGVNDYQISGEPNWVDSDAYDIDAKMDDDAAAAFLKLPDEERAEQRKRIFQALLAERLGLNVKHETKDLPVFAMVVTKGGVKFSPTKSPAQLAGAPDSSADPNQPRRGVDVEGRGREYTLTGTGVKMSRLANALSDQPEVERRLVIDETGLTGEYDLALKWTQEKPTDIREAGGSAVLDTSWPSLFTALQEQLGLKLEAKKGPVDTIVIVHVERPSEN
jgi:uncharacterized protein (TIGR03435 family)